MERAARRIGWLGAVGLAILVTMMGALPARAHVAIRLDILEPQPDQVVGPHPTVVVFAQPMLAGADRTTFVPTLDGVPIDPDSGATVTAPQHVEIRAGERRRLSLRGLDDGEHVITLTYSPDIDVEPTTASVTFRVGSAGGGVSAGLIAGLIAFAVAVAVGAVRAWRRRGGRRRSPARARR
jgi:hypothetical protein